MQMFLFQQRGPNVTKMKRKSKVLNDEKFTKKRRLEEVKEEEDGREDHGTSFNDHSTSPSVSASHQLSDR